MLFHRSEKTNKTFIKRTPRVLLGTRQLLFCEGRQCGRLGKLPTGVLGWPRGCQQVQETCTEKQLRAGDGVRSLRKACRFRGDESESCSVKHSVVNTRFLLQESPQSQLGQEWNSEVCLKLSNQTVK